MTKKPMPRILIVEDELPMRTALADCLSAEGYRVLLAEDGKVGLRLALEEKPDLVLLDIMMPRLDGMSVCAELRRTGQKLPILMVTARGQLQDKVKGLDVGADDYLIKPFSVEELLARIRALLRRFENRTQAVSVLKLGDNVIDLQRQTAIRKGRPLELTAKEFAILRLLAEREGEPVTREQFLDQVWSYTSFPTTRTVDNHIATLREKLGENPAKPDWILTVHGVGYRLVLAKS